MIGNGEGLRKIVEYEMRALVKKYREEHGLNEAKKIARDEYLDELFDTAINHSDSIVTDNILKILMVMNLRTW